MGILRKLMLPAILLSLLVFLLPSPIAKANEIVDAGQRVHKGVPRSITNHPVVAYDDLVH